MTQRLPGKVIVVTGAGAGVGREIALEAARQGAPSMLTPRSFTTTRAP